MKAVVLAGGLGERMRPQTLLLPKPMLPVGGAPLLEHTVRWLARNGFRDVVMCTSYMHRVIEDYFGDGSGHGARVRYAVSRRPLSTAGQMASAAAEAGGAPFACVYGDGLYSFSLRAMARQHLRRRPFATVAVDRRSFRLPYGVASLSRGGRVLSWEEKPSYERDVVAGCYIFDPGAFAMVPRGRPYGMDRLVSRAIAAGRRVDSFPVRGGFRDAGDASEYARISGGGPP